MIKGFKQYTEQAVNPVVFTFGRFNPPTIGHLKLLDKVASLAKGRNYRVYASQSNDPKKNPLLYKEKVQFMRKMFPKHGRNIVMDPRVKTVFDIAVKLYDEGFNQLNMVVGGDRVAEFEKLLIRYNDVKGRHGYYNFIEGINIISAGRRDPDSEGVEGMSASKMRAAAVDGDFKSFQLGLPKGYSDGVTLFNTLRKRMGLREITDFREHVQLDTVSEQRELYTRGEIFNVGDIVYCLDEEVTIKERKPNYVVATNNKKYWIKDLTEKKNPRIPRKKGQPAGSKKHSDLYTDENPKGTIKGLGFKDVKTAEASIKKIENSGKTHAHKIQAAIAMEQRAKVMGKKGPAAVYRRYIEKMKKITKKRNEDVKSFKEMFDEKLDPRKHDAGDYIKDFMKSDAPQFKGKSKEEIKKMAIAAYLQAKDDAGITEKSKGLWHNIHQKRKRGEKPRKKFSKGAPTKKAFKSAQGEDVEEGKAGKKKKSEPWPKQYERRVVRTTKPEHKKKGYNWRIKGKERNEISIKLYKTKPSYKEFTKQMKRVAGHEFGG